MMDYEKILSQLRSLKVETHSMVCFGCGKEHNCGVHGCAVIRSGIEAIEELLIERENFRRQLGDTRKDLQDSEAARTDLAKRLTTAQQERDALVRRDYPKTEKWEVPGPEYFRELERVAKRYIIFGCNYFPYIFAPGRIVWDKCNGSSTFSDCEIAATNCHDSVRLFRYLWNGMMQGKSIDQGEIQRGDKRTNERRFHPTQKPIDLYRWIFREYAQPGFKILDTHLGSGRSRMAAYEAGLDFVGCEIEKIYYDLQEEDFAAFTAQERLF